MPNPLPNALASPDTPLALPADGDLATFTASLAKGEDAAWATFYERYRARLLGYLARTWLGESACLDDLLQETLLRAVRHMRVFRDEDGLWSWLTVLARSAVADRGRRRSRWWKFLRRWRHESALQALPASPAKFAAHLDAALAKLDPHSRALIEAKYYHRRPVRTIATDLECSEKAVEGRLTRARQKLAKLLEASSHDPRP